MSLTVNAVVTGLIVLRILKVYLEVKSAFEDRTLDVGGGNVKLRSIVFIIIESGVVMFAIQFIRLVLTILNLDALEIIISINQMFNVIIRSVISIFTLLNLFLGNNTHHHPFASVDGVIFL
jgi:hypothetical protein